MRQDEPREGFDGAAAVTRSLLGYGVLSGVFYLIVGLVLGITREGFDFSAHPLSVLMLGEDGWLQRVNLIVTGAMVIAAAVGFARILQLLGASRRVSWLLFLYALSLIASGIFAPDPVGGFPPGSTDGQVTVSGILHLAFAAIGFIGLVAAGFVLAGWHRRLGDPRLAAYSRVSAVLILVGFVAGASLATQTAGIVSLWIAVLAGWIWLAIASIDMYKRVPHPLIAKRTVPA